jgi:hypothetical protein
LGVVRRGILAVRLLGTLGMSAEPLLLVHY